MKLDTSQADRLPPYVKGYTDLGEGDDSLPEVFYAAWRDYLKKHPIRTIDSDMKEEYPDASRGKRVDIYYARLRRHLQQTMFHWLDEHDGVVDRWPFPALDGWNGVVWTRTNYDTGTTSNILEFPFKLFEHSYAELPNGFTNCDTPRAPKMPHTCTECVDYYKAHYWDAYEKKKKEYEFQVKVLQDYQKESAELKEGLRVTPLKVLAMLIWGFFALNSAVLFAYCFTGLFDYKKLVDWLFALTQSSFLPVKILAWPVFVLQYINHFLFRNFVPLRTESIIATVIGYAILLVVLLCWVGALILGIWIIFSCADPKKLSENEKEILVREKRVQELKKKLDDEKARLDASYLKDQKYQLCVKEDQERTQWLKDSDSRWMAIYHKELEKYQPYEEMIRAYYNYLEKQGLIKEPLRAGDWEPHYVSVKYN